MKREERQRRVLELHNQGKNTCEIAEILHMSFRDIGLRLKKQEVDKEHAQQQFQASQAYKLFSDGKASVQVAIELNLSNEMKSSVAKSRANEIYLQN